MPPSSVRQRTGPAGPRDEALLIDGGILVAAPGELDPVPGGCVLVRGNRIEWAGPGSALPSVHGPVTRIDASGCAILPGLVPKPSVIASTLHGNWSGIWSAQWTTLTEAVIGYVIGGVLGFASAVVVAMTGIGRRLVPGLAGAVNALPIVALAPIAVLDLGYGGSSKIAVVTLLTGAVMALNACKGLTSVAGDPLYLMYSYAASRWQILTKLRVMNALPYVFTALKYNVTIALVGAIIAEFFGAYGGVGPEMVQALSAFAMPLAWSVMVVVGAVGILWYEALVGLERLCPGWHSSYRRP